MKRILVASDKPETCDIIRDCLHLHYKPDIVPDAESCLQMFRKKRYEFVFIEMNLLGDANGNKCYKEKLNHFWQIYPAIKIIVLTDQAKIRDAVNAVKAGANNYLTHPIKSEELTYVMETADESTMMQLELNYLRDKFWKSDSLELIRTNSPLMKKVFEQLKAVAPTKTTVLLTGETGTGKGVLARLIHHHSNRSDRQFISVHCGAIPDTLLESELFGHERGSFTGAVRRKLGKFEIAQGGTIFLDEIGTITASAQIKMLQVLQDRIFQRVGGSENIEADVRIIAATNDDLKKMVDRGVYRKDLFYRLSVFPVEIPPLRERREDMSSLTEFLLEKLNSFHSKRIQSVHPHVMNAFLQYHFPGNIRELENLIERAYILESSAILTPESLPSDIIMPNTTNAPIVLNTSLPLAEVRRRALEDVERQYLKELLALHKGRINSTAQTAGITSRQLHKLLTKYRIHKEDFKNFSSHATSES